MMIVNARPTMNPFITGSGMKLARNPSRNRPAISAASPVVIASPAVSATNLLLPIGANDATVAADSAAVAPIGPVTSWRELPGQPRQSADPGCKRARQRLHPAYEQRLLVGAGRRPVAGLYSAVSRL